MIIIYVPIGGHTIFFGDNVSVVNGASILESNLLKNHLGICYHAVREAYADGTCKVGFVKGTYNIANWITKILYGTAN